MSDSSADFWKDAAGGSLLPHYVLGRFGQVAAKFTADEADEMEDELDNVLDGLYSGLTMADVMTGREAARRSETGCWAGRYALLDDAGYTYVLNMTSAGADALVGDDILEEYTFVDGVLKIGHETHQFELQFELPQPAADDVVETAIQRGQPRCHGLVRIVRDGQTETHQVRGKRGCFTVEGIARDTDGDPEQTWEGGYTLYFPDTQETLQNALTLDPRPGKVTVALREVAGTHVSYVNNHLVFRVGDDADHRFGAAFEVTNDGSRRFIGVERRDGVDRRVVGFLTHRLLDRTRRPTLLAAAATVGPAKLGAATPFSIALTTTPTTTTTVDGKQVTTNAPDARVTYSLPKGSERTFYELTLTLTGLTGLDTAKAYPIDVVDDLEANPEPFMPIKQLLTIDAATVSNTTTLTTKLRATQGETHSAAVYYFKIVQGALSARVRFEIYSLETLVIGDTACPPAVRGKSYRVVLSASGGRPPYTWTPITSGLPEGLKFDPATATISGTVGAENARSQETYSVVAEVSCASDVVGMLAARQTLYFQIVEGEQIGGIGANWATFVIGGIAGLIVMIDWVVGKFKDTPTDKMAGKIDKFFADTDNNRSPMSKFLENIETLNKAIAEDTKTKTDLTKLKEDLEKANKAKAADILQLQQEVDRLKQDLKREGADRKKIERDLKTAQDKVEAKEKARKKAETEKKEAENKLAEEKAKHEATDRVKRK